MNVNAMMGLSSPLSGIKNILIQVPRSAAIYGLRRTLAGYARVFMPSAWHEARMKGQLEYGTKAIAQEAGDAGGFMKRMTRGVFKWNLMQVTENANRIAVSYAGKLYSEGLIGQLRGETRFFKTFMSKSEIRRFFNETLEMTEADIKFLETSELSQKKIG